MIAYISDNERAKQLVSYLLCASVGLLISIFPHMIAWWKTGQPYYIADHDDLVYLATAGQSYFNHPFRLDDPMLMYSHGGGIFPYLQFAPGILPAKFLSGSPLFINFYWRVFAGISIGLTWRLLLGQLFHKSLLATVFSIVMLCDIGLLSGHIIIKPITTGISLMLGHGSELFSSYPQILTQWRIITPGLSLAYLLFHVWAVACYREKRVPLRLCLAGLSLGLLFYAYFYYWTAAVCALVLCFLLDSGRRGVYFTTSLVGVLIGTPALIAGYQLKHASVSSEWLQRTDNFLPIPRFSELLIPMSAVLILVFAGVWIYLRRRDYLYVCSLAFVGTALVNHQIVSGLQIQNFHFIYVWGPMVSLTVVLALCEGLTWAEQRYHKHVKMLALPFALVWITIALCFRMVETTRTSDTITIAQGLHNYLEERGDLARSTRTFVPRGVISGDEEFIEFSAAFENVRPLIHYATMFSPSIDNDEWDRRIALNAYLSGITLPEFEKSQRKVMAGYIWGPWTRNRSELEKRFQNRVAHFGAISKDSITAINDFDVRYVALVAGEALPDNVRESFRLFQTGPWTIWERAHLRNE